MVEETDCGYFEDIGPSFIHQHTANRIHGTSKSSRVTCSSGKSTIVRNSSKCILLTLSQYFTSLLKVKTAGHQTRSQDWITLDTHDTYFELGKTSLQYFAPHKWNKLQRTLKLENLVPLDGL